MTFNTHFVNIADGIGNHINGIISLDYQNEESLINMISKYDSRPIILAIKKKLVVFQFSEELYDDVYLLHGKLEPKRALVATTSPLNFWKLVLFLLVFYGNW